MHINKFNSLDFITKIGSRSSKRSFFEMGGDRKVVKSQNECCRQGDGDTFSPPSLHLNVYGSNLLKNRLTIPSMKKKPHL